MAGYTDVENQDDGGFKATLIRHKKVLFGVLVLLVVGTVVGVIVGVALKKSDNPLSISVEGIMAHLQALEDVAMLERNAGSRAVATGYNDSANYVISQLQIFKEYYDFWTQPFVLPIWRQNSPPTLSILNSDPEIILQLCPYRTGWQRYRDDCDFAGIRYGGDGESDLTGKIIHIPGGGCNATEYDGFPANSVALVPVGICDYFTKGLRAQAGGASALILYATSSFPGSQAWNPDWEEGDALVMLPVLGVTNSVSLLLRQNGGSTVRITTNQTVALQRTYNIIAETKSADSESVVFFGAHLDGVPEGPGVNDNGSGSSLILEAALELARRKLKPRNTLRFAWWAAEEVGLVGSRHYVREIVADTKEYDKIKLYLNFDMQASPNFIRHVHDAQTAPPDVQEGSAVLEKLFCDYFDSMDIPWEKVGLYGGSDFYPFMLAGIPVNGLGTGAGGIKSMEERERQGGIALAQHDPCYHAPCDTVANIAQDCLRDFAGAVAHVIEDLAARDLDKFLPTARRYTPALLREKLAQYHANLPEAY